MSLSRILAIDPGTKRVGLAVSDPLGLTAQPLPFLEYGGDSSLIEELKKLIKEKEVRLVIVGLPKNMDGTLGPRAQECIRLSEKIREKCAIEVRLWDERLSTKQAERILTEEADLSRKKRKFRVDSMASCLILQSFLDSQIGTPLD